ncbi:hypothetical protein B0E37_02197 [Streptomyces sp. MH192]|nr:hypothetical protein [Streptomyces sp. MH192]MCF0099025.1 hypothetical protein [Streptomyces sp. MH191]
MTTPMTVKELLELPPTVDLVTAGRAFGVGRTTSYALARNGEFPCRVIRAGKAYRAVTADLLRVLHIGEQNRGDAGPCPSDAA